MIFSAMASRIVGMSMCSGIGLADVGAELLAQALGFGFRQMHSALLECSDEVGVGASDLLLFVGRKPLGHMGLLNHKSRKGEWCLDLLEAF